MRKRMDRKKLILIFSIFFVSVISLSIVYAALSTTLNISGSSEVVASSWNITLKENDLSFVPESVRDIFIINGNSVILGGGTINNKPTINGTRLETFSVSVSKPGDAAALYYDITNNGTIPAILSKIVYSDFSYSASNPNDIEWVKSNLRIYNGNFVEISEDIFEEGDVLCPGQTELILVGAEISLDVTNIPTGSVTISGINTTLEFVQGDLSLCS